MNWIDSLQTAIDYIEKNITNDIDFEKISKIAYSSNFHFQKVFSLFTGVSLGEYIRLRRLTIAGKEILTKKVKSIDIAFKYGYHTAESFARAFFKFHGILPSQVKNYSSLKTYSPIHIKLDYNGGSSMDYKIKTFKQVILVGFKKRFKGVPYGEERAKQEESFFISTRAKQWILIGASSEPKNDYCVITNVNDEGYDFYIAYKLDDWSRKELYNPSITGVEFIEKLGFEEIVIPENKYVIFKTEKLKRPIANYVELRKQIVMDFLPSVKYSFLQAPELTILHWRPNGNWEKERYIEICLPIIKNSNN